jgi:hypothetical protein
VINVSLHVGEPMTDADVDKIVAAIDAMADAIASKKAEFATNVVLVEADNGPTAKQRKRIGEATSKLPRSYQVLVTKSAVVRAVVTAIRWFSSDKLGNHHETFATWSEARDWIVERTGHNPDVLDTMVAEVRSRAGVRP